MVHVTTTNTAKKKAKGPVTSGSNPNGRYNEDQPPHVEYITDVFSYGDNETNITGPSHISHSDDTDMANADMEVAVQPAEHSGDSPTPPAPYLMQTDPLLQDGEGDLNYTDLQDDIYL
jgi:hypothetical protein